ncbi:hypothetical protein ACH5RR_041020 [Cinchona calisaya]|uniref:Uncharacterized protein n=1 Tax=Cinchona calisaya TaxID=153742 RepID=A0ABD2XXS7_9GENT
MEQLEQGYTYFVQQHVADAVCKDFLEDAADVHGVIGVHALMSIDATTTRLDIRAIWKGEPGWARARVVVVLILFEREAKDGGFARNEVKKLRS